MSFKRKYICLTGWEKDGRVVNGVKIDLKPTTNMKTNLTKKIISGIVWKTLYDGLFSKEERR